MNENYFNDVYNILVEHAGASAREDAKPSFIYSHVHDTYPCREYRFCGDLGFGGKYRAQTNRIDYYGEDKTKERDEIVQVVNAKLSKMGLVTKRIELNDVLRAGTKARIEHPELRIGQSFYTALHGINSMVANYLTGTDVDPFNNDDRIEAFFEYIENLNNRSGV